ncbi:hypothetical protein [Saccharothrix carnea]|uniref:hypothetical protein n=1 Tax=Saccharothrix carnea TaxID=1280637 RepID=UPI0011B230BE|nr:hypothetical protein [Saccharothrix carnea]
MLHEAVRAAYERERQLFEERAHERSIVFHIARHLAVRVEAVLPGWSVDVDYDRWHPNGIELLKKRLAGLRSDYTENDVYPDIIIHRRTGSSRRDNLLVVEVKKEEASRSEQQHDQVKLQAFMKEPFYYQNAAFLILPKNGDFPRLEWIRPPMPPSSCPP